jgi:Zn-dependent protease
MIGNFDIVQWLQQLIYWLPGILVGFVLHEFSHAFVANQLGDPTPKLTGRLTLNPIAHIDPIGFILLILVHFGWAKPVMTNPALYKKHKRHGFALVSVAGVTMNFILGFAIMFVTLFLLMRGVIENGSAWDSILENAAGINFILMAFNLIPIPPLDGYNILKDLVLIKHVRPQTLWNFERYGQFVLLALVLLGGTSAVIGAVSGFFQNVGIGIFNLVFHTSFYLA